MLLDALALGLAALFAALGAFVAFGAFVAGRSFVRAHLYCARKASSPW